MGLGLRFRRRGIGEVGAREFSHPEKILDFEGTNSTGGEGHLWRKGGRGGFHVEKGPPREVSFFLHVGIDDAWKTQRRCTKGKEDKHQLTKDLTKKNMWSGDQDKDEVLKRFYAII